MSIARRNLNFPSREANTRALWAPLLFSPRPGSPERLVIGVAAVDDAGFHLAEGNAWRRLACLFDADADTALLAVRTAFDRMRVALAANGTNGLGMYQPPFSGIELGTIQTAEAPSTRELAELWLSELSSLYDRDIAAAAAQSSAAGVALSAGATANRGDRLPLLVREYVEQRRPVLAQAFSAEYQDLQRQARVPAQRVRIAFSGSRLVANFATLPARRSKATIEHIKSLVLDLETDRQRDRIGGRKWEMIVQHQARDDPQIKPRQYEAVLEVLDELGEQARIRDLAMLPYTSVQLIGNHVLEVERRAVAA